MSDISTSTDAVGASRADLDRLYAQSPAGSIPVGRGEGTVLLGSGRSFSRLINELIRTLFWQGKHFDPVTNDLQNLLAPIGTPAVRALVYQGPSLTDGAPCTILDYSQTSLVARPIRDEIREVAPDNFLGIVFVAGRRVPIEFWLTFSAHGADPAIRSRRFALEERPVGWAEQATIRIQRELLVPADPAQVFSLLADHEGWTSWFKGMRRVRVDGAASGVGAERTVWVGASRVRERFIGWQDGARLTFNIIESSLPGLRAMQEDWTLEPSQQGTRLTITIGLEAAGPLRSVPRVVKGAVAQSTKGAAGLVEAFS